MEIAKNNHDAFVALTTKVAALHDQMDRQREKYHKWRRIVFGDEGDALTTALEKSTSKTAAEIMRIGSENIGANRMRFFEIGD